MDGWTANAWTDVQKTSYPSAGFLVLMLQGLALFNLHPSIFRDCCVPPVSQMLTHANMIIINSSCYMLCNVCSYQAVYTFNFGLTEAAHNLSFLFVTGNQVGVGLTRPQSVWLDEDVS